jgi:hypothetical protein
VSTTPTSKQRRGVRIVSKTKVPLPPQLKRVNLDAAAIDIGAEEHWAPVPPGRNTKGRTCADSEPSPENCALWRTG